MMLGDTLKRYESIWDRISQNNVFFLNLWMMGGYR